MYALNNVGFHLPYILEPTLFDLIIYVPVSNLIGMSGRVVVVEPVLCMN